MKKNKLDKNKLCKNCQLPWKEHAQFILDWDHVESHEQVKVCNKFAPMSNLDYLEWKEQNDRNSGPTREGLL